MNTVLSRLRKDVRDFARTTLELEDRSTSLLLSIQT
jgi:hypothetical protein